MAYVKLDDQIAHHPKVLRAGAEAAWLWAVAIAYCNRQLTDGVVPAEALATLGTFKTSTVKLAARLVDVGLFEVCEGGYAVHDYLTHNPDKVTVLARIKEATERKAAARAKQGPPKPPTPSGTRSPVEVSLMSQRDTSETHSASRTYVPPPPPTPKPTPHPPASESEAGDAPAATSSVVPFDPNNGAMPTRRRNPAMAWEGQREGLGVPAKLHADLLSRMATPDERVLWSWYAETERAWQGKAVGATCWQFWNARFGEWQGLDAARAALTPAPAKRSPWDVDIEAVVAAQRAAKATERAS